MPGGVFGFALVGGVGSAFGGVGSAFVVVVVAFVIGEEGAAEEVVVLCAPELREFFCCTK